MTDLGLSWLAGFWDADGCIGITKRRTYLVPFASCCNTNKKIIDNVTRILDEHGVEYQLEYQDRGGRINAAPAWSVRLESRKRVSKFLPLIRDYLVGKQEQADIVINWCSLPNAYKGKGNDVVYPDGYWESKEILSELNARGRSSRVRG
jgi:hypothetical protein